MAAICPAWCSPRLTALRELPPPSRPARAAKPSKVKAGASPDVTGMSLRRAMERFALAGAVPEVRGDGLTVFRQQPAPGEALEKDGSPRPCIVWMSREAYEEDIRKAEQQAAAQAVETAQAAAVPAPRQEKASSVQPGKTEAEKKDSSTGSPRQKTGTGDSRHRPPPGPEPLPGKDMS